MSSFEDAILGKVRRKIRTGAADQADTEPAEDWLERSRDAEARRWREQNHALDLTPDPRLDPFEQSRAVQRKQFNRQNKIKEQG